MTSPNPLEWDDCEQLLSPPTGSGDAELREAILRQTRRVVGRRRWVRRVLAVAAMLLCYGAGAATMQLWPSAARSRPEPIAQQTPAPPQPKPVEMVATKPAPPQNTRPAEPPLSAYQRLRRYSDRVLDQQGDIALATRYYARALDHASAEERAISTEDTWLLTALKADRFQEKTHENHGS